MNAPLEVLERPILPQNLTPSHYALQISTDLDEGTFNGTVDVDIRINQDTDSIIVNAIDINIHSATIDNVKAKSISYDIEEQTARLDWEKGWKADQRKRLTMIFDAKLNENLAGFYRSSYQTKDGATAYMAVTQFAPVDARRAFPCWDEPALKATFDLTLTSKSTLVQLSNMSVMEEKTHNSLKVTKYHTTPIMSTYLLVWAIGDFEYVESTAFRAPVRTYTVPGYKHQGNFAAELGAQTLAFFEQQFGIEYPLMKMDFLAVPNFSFGAMENWGLVTYREVLLLLDEENASASTKERIASVVQHELAHQWFGNLVTMDFWEGLWLNEGFATWMAMFANSRFFPEWKNLESFVARDLQSGLQLDSLRNSHPVEVPVTRTDQIYQILDSISYSKGCCVLAMLARYLGEQTFINGVSRYLKKYAYGNTTTDQLWESLSVESGKDVSRLMQTWTRKIGFPVITVAETKDSLEVKQNRFLNAGDATEKEDQVLYVVPLALKTIEREGPIVHEISLDGRKSTIQMGEDQMQVYKLNADQYGFYRTNYTPSRLKAIGTQAIEQQLFFSVQDRAGLVADTGALSAAGYAKTSAFLTLIGQWKNEDAFLVWSAMLSRIKKLRAAWVFESQKVKDALCDFELRLTSQKAKELGWTFHKGEDHILVQFKALMFGAAGKAGDPSIKAAAFEMFSRFTQGEKTAIWPDLRDHVFGMAVQYGGEKEYNTILDIYLHPQSEQVKLSALSALGLARNHGLIQQTLQFSISKNVKLQDIATLLSSLQRHSDGILKLWEWAKQNWDEIARILSIPVIILGHVLEVVTGGLTTSVQLAEIETFFKSKSTKGIDRSLGQSIDSIKSKQKWVQRDSSDVYDYLLNNGYMDT